MSRLPPARTELDLAVAEGFLTQSDLGRLVAGGADAQAELRARLGDQAWARLEAQAAELRAVGAEDQILVDELPGRYRPHQDPRRTEPREIGHGAQGAVQVVWDAQLERDVAMKVLRPGMSSARFVREARVLSRLDHPGLPTLYELGRSSAGLLYFTMRYVRGRPISEAARTLDLRALLEVYLRACEVIAYAHSRGVIHRDLKPEHLVVGEYGKVAVLDWGLARVLNLPEIAGDAEVGGTGGVTAVGLALGTPGYRAPEQEQGLPAGPAADVFALGKVLEELLLEATSPPLRSILRRATARDPSARYSSVLDLNVDLQAWLRDGVVQAHHYTALEQVARLRRRHSRLLSALSPVLVLTAAAVAALAAYAKVQEVLRAPLYIEQALQILTDNGDPAEAQVLAAESLRIKDTPEARGALIAAMSRWRPRLVAIHSGPDPAQPCTVVAVHSSGTWACLGDHHLGVEVRRPGDEVPTLARGFNGRTAALSWHPSGQGLISLAPTTVLDANGEHPALTVSGMGDLADVSLQIVDAWTSVREAQWLDTERFVLSMVHNHRVVIAAFTRGRSISDWEIPIPTSAMDGGRVAISAGRVFVSTLDGHMFELDPQRNGEIVHEWHIGNTGSVLSADDRWVAAAGTSAAEHSGRIVLTPLVDGAAEVVPIGGDENRSSIVVESGIQARAGLLFASNGTMLAAHSPTEGKVAFVDLNNRSILSSLVVPKRPTSSLNVRTESAADNASRRLYIAGGHSPDLYEFSLSPDPWRAVIPSFDGAAMRAQFAPEGDELVTAGRGAEAVAWSLRDLSQAQRYSFNPDGLGQPLVVTRDCIYAHAAESGTWAIDRATQETVALAGAAVLETMALSPDDRWLALGTGGRGDLVILDTQTQHEVSRVAVFEHSIFTLAWLSPGELLAGSFRNGARLLDVDDRGAVTRSREVKGFWADAGRGSVSADGRTVAYGVKGDAAIHQLDLLTGGQLALLTGHTDWPIMVAQGVVPGHGELLASASWDGTLRLWTRGHILAVFHGHKGALWDADFSPDGSMLSSAGADGTARIWRLFVDTDGDGDDDLDLLNITGEEALQDAYDRFGLTLDEDGKVVYAPGWALPGKR